MDLNTIFFIGPQGSGKGTQAKILAQKINYFIPNSENPSDFNFAKLAEDKNRKGLYWEMGEILRQVAKENSDLGQRVKKLIDAGVLLNDEQLYEVIDSRLLQIPPHLGVIFDGVPRRVAQAQHLLDFLKGQGRTNFTTLFVNVPHDDSIKRLLLRSHKEGRADDTKEGIELRLKQYYKDTTPVLDLLRKESQFFEINGQPSIEKVTKEIDRVLEIDPGSESGMTH